MESIPYHPLLQVTQEEVIATRQSWDLDANKINENLDAIEEWFKKQDHLVEALPYLSRDMMERFHILGRGSIELTKSIIDKVLTIKGMIPEFLHNDPKSSLKEYDVLLDNMMVIPLPKANPKDNTRIFLHRINNEAFEDIDILQMTKFGCFTLEVRMRHDYLFSERLIYDFQHVKASMITKLNPLILKKIEAMFSDSYKLKLKGIHMINTPPFINKIIYILKQAVKEKIANRVFVHSTYEDLYKKIPKEVLPKEYGGDEASCSDLTERWKNYLKTEDVLNILETSSKMISNESKRSSIKFNEEYLGMPGSFKRLNVD